MAYINVDEVYILDNTGLQVDQTTDLPFKDAGLTESQQAQARKNIAAGGTNPNLLDNPFFTVRQRGNGPFNGAGFTVDRWSISGASSTLTANSGYISLNMAANAVFLQRIGVEIELGKPYTASLMERDGTIYSATFTPTVSENIFALGPYICVFDARATYAPNYRFYIYKETAWTADLKAAKLERGSVSTLANDTAPDYGTELVKCQRYFTRMSANSSYCQFATGFISSTTGRAMFTLVNSVPLRATATVTVHNLVISMPNGTSATVTGVVITRSSANTNTIQLLVSIDTTQTLGTPCALQSADATGYIDISCDL